MTQTIKQAGVSDVLKRIIAALSKERVPGTLTSNALRTGARWGPAALTGVGTGLYANHEGADVGDSIALGAGAGLLASPYGVPNAWRAGRMANAENDLIRAEARLHPELKNKLMLGLKDPSHEALLKLKGPLLAKLGIGGTWFAGKYGVPAIKNFYDTSTNVKDTTAAAAKNAPTISTNIDRLTNLLAATSANAYDLTGGSTGKDGPLVQSLTSADKAMQSLSAAGEGIKGLPGAVASVGTGLTDAVKPIQKGVDSLDKNLGELNTKATGVADKVTSAAGTLATTATDASKGISDEYNAAKQGIGNLVSSPYFKYGVPASIAALMGYGLLKSYVGAPSIPARPAPKAPPVLQPGQVRKKRKVTIDPGDYDLRFNQLGVDKPEDVDPEGGSKIASHRAALMGL